jgi:hypothetical protein
MPFAPDFRALTDAGELLAALHILTNVTPLSSGVTFFPFLRKYLSTKMPVACICISRFHKKNWRSLSNLNLKYSCISQFSQNSFLKVLCG